MNSNDPRTSNTDPYAAIKEAQKAVEEAMARLQQLKASESSGDLHSEGAVSLRGSGFSNEAAAASGVRPGSGLGGGGESSSAGAHLQGEESFFTPELSFGAQKAAMRQAGREDIGELKNILAAINARQPDSKTGAPGTPATDPSLAYETLQFSSGGGAGGGGPYGGAGTQRAQGHNQQGMDVAHAEPVFMPGKMECFRGRELPATLIFSLSQKFQGLLTQDLYRGWEVRTSHFEWGQWGLPLIRAPRYTYNMVARGPAEMVNPTTNTLNRFMRMHPALAQFVNDAELREDTSGAPSKPFDYVREVKDREGTPEQVMYKHAVAFAAGDVKAMQQLAKLEREVRKAYQAFEASTTDPALAASLAAAERNLHNYDPKANVDPSNENAKAAYRNAELATKLYNDFVRARGRSKRLKALGAFIRTCDSMTPESRFLIDVPINLVVEARSEYARINFIDDRTGRPKGDRAPWRNWYNAVRENVFWDVNRTKAFLLGLSAVPSLAGAALLGGGATLNLGAIGVGGYTLSALGVGAVTLPALGASFGMVGAVAGAYFGVFIGKRILWYTAKRLEQCYDRKTDQLLHSAVKSEDPFTILAAVREAMHHLREEGVGWGVHERKGAKTRGPDVLARLMTSLVGNRESDADKSADGDTQGIAARMVEYARTFHKATREGKDPHAREEVDIRFLSGLALDANEELVVGSRGASQQVKLARRYDATEDVLRLKRLGEIDGKHSKCFPWEQEEKYSFRPDYEALRSLENVVYRYCLNWGKYEEDQKAQIAKMLGGGIEQFLSKTDLSSKLQQRKCRFMMEGAELLHFATLKV